MSTQLVNLCWMPNSVSKGFGKAMRTKQDNWDDFNDTHPTKEIIFRGNFVLSFLLSENFQMALQLLRFQSPNLSQVKSLLSDVRKIKRGSWISCCSKLLFLPSVVRQLYFTSNQKTMKGFYHQLFSKIISLLNKMKTPISVITVQFVQSI